MLRFYSVDIVFHKNRSLAMMEEVPEEACFYEWAFATLRTGNGEYRSVCHSRFINASVAMYLEQFAVCYGEDR